MYFHLIQRGFHVRKPLLVDLGGCGLSRKLNLYIQNMIAGGGNSGCNAAITRVPRSSRMTPDMQRSTCKIRVDHSRTHRQRRHALQSGHATSLSTPTLRKCYPPPKLRRASWQLATSCNNHTILRSKFHQGWWAIQ